MPSGSVSGQKRIETFHIKEILSLISIWIIRVLTYDILIFVTSWSIIHETFLINSFVSTETQTEESTAEANYGSITKSHLGYKCHVGNEELN